MPEYVPVLKVLQSSERHAPRMRYRCPACSEIHQGFPALAYQLPDPIYALTADERDARAIISSDLCILDDRRHFVRCVLSVDVNGYDEQLEFGPWVEIDRNAFSRYSVWFNLAASPGWSQVKGKLANAFPAQEQTTLGLSCCLILPDTDDERPTVKIMDPKHPLFDDQAAGISIARATELVSSLKGYMLILD